METKAAVLWDFGKDWTVEDIRLDPPRNGEVLVEFSASGLCHSNEHIRAGESVGVSVPMIPCHEGAGIVREVGPGVTTLAPGDSVVTIFVPSCGRCAMCATGHQSLCDMNADIAGGRQLSDGTARHHATDGTDIGIESRVGSAAYHGVVHESACVPIPGDVPHASACLLGCGVVTGWGSAVYAGGGVQPGEAVVVAGIGGVGINAVQGARLAGAELIFAVDPVPWKREQALAFGATHVAESVADAFPLVQEVTWGRMANAVIMTMGTGDGQQLGSAVALAGKRGRIVITNVHPPHETEVRLSLREVTVYEKQIHGSLYGSANARADIPKLIRLYRAGLLDLDGLVTRTYPLEGINTGFRDMLEGRNLRGVLQLAD